MACSAERALAGGRPLHEMRDLVVFPCLAFVCVRLWALFFFGGVFLLSWFVRGGVFVFIVGYVLPGHPNPLITPACFCPCFTCAHALRTCACRALTLGALAGGLKEKWEGQPGEGEGPVALGC